LNPLKGGPAYYCGGQEKEERVFLDNWASEYAQEGRGEAR